jgi:hypothetical protein
LSELTGILADIAAIAGPGAALNVARARGGMEKVWIPRASYLHEGHWLVDAVGLAPAQRIAELLGPGRVDIPLGPFADQRRRTREALRRALAGGSSTAVAARLVGVHQRTARRHKSGADAPQLDLLSQHAALLRTDKCPG